MASPATQRPTADAKQKTTCVRCHGTGIRSTRYKHLYCTCPAGQEVRDARLALRDGSDPNASGPPF